MQRAGRTEAASPQSQQRVDPHARAEPGRPGAPISQGKAQVQILMSIKGTCICWLLWWTSDVSVTQIPIHFSKISWGSDHSS